VQLEFALKIKTGNDEDSDAPPFRNDPFYQGWTIFNEIMGIISIYTVNLMYALNSLTWLMITNKCDFYNKTDDE